MTKYQYDIENWSEDDLLDLPNMENDTIEYKSSKVPLDKLKDKISVAASAFWNSGGGIFIAGVDDVGKIDGGVVLTFGRQKIRDWADQVIASVEPQGEYIIQVIEKSDPKSSIQNDHGILVIGFRESYNGPHMAPDRKYYGRIGAHTGPLSHFLVEAVRARRGLNNPKLRGVLRPNDRKSNTIELVVVALNIAPALISSLTLSHSHEYLRSM